MSTPRWAEKIAAFDTETTGVDPFDARLVSAAIVEFDENGTRETTWEIDPGVLIPPAASRIHGVWDQDRAGRQDHADAIEQIAEALGLLWAQKYTVVVYNAAFDLTLLRECIRRDHGRDWQPGGLVVDPMVIDRALDQYRKGRRTLTDQCRHYGVELTDAHNAVADAVAAAHLARKVGAKWNGVLNVHPAELMSVQQKLAKDNERGLREWFVKTGRDPKEIVGGWPIRESV